MSYTSKIYNPKDIFYAEDVNNIITGIDELNTNVGEINSNIDDINTDIDRLKELYEEAHPDIVNLLSVDKLDHSLRYSPGTGGIVSSSGTKYSLFVCKLKPNTTYTLTHCIGGFGLFASQPATNTVATYKFESSYSPVTFDTKECSWIAANTQMVNTNTAETTENTPVEAWLNASLMEVVEDEPEDGDYVTKDELFTQEFLNMINPQDISYNLRYSTGSSKFVADTLAIGITGLIEVVEDEWYTVSGSGIYGLSSSNCQGGYFTENAEIKANQAAVESISFVTPVAGAGMCFQVPTGKNIKYVVINLKLNSDKTAVDGNVQLELGEMPTAYEPYNPKTVIKPGLLPSGLNSGGGNSSSTDDFTKALDKYTTFDNLHYYGIDKKIAKFKQHWLHKDKNLCVVNTGTSLTARSSEHCSTKLDASSRPPLMHSNNFASHIWDALKWEGQQYRRYDYIKSGVNFFSETGAFVTASKIDEWDDGAYRYGITRYSDEANSSIAFTVPADAWQFNFIYRTDSHGSDDCVLSIAEGNGLMVVQNENGEWVEANGYTFTQLEPEITTIESFNYLDPVTQTEKTMENYQVKGNTTYQKRLYMKAVSRNAAKNITISHTSGRLLYWGVEWSPREFMITYINAARGSHSSAISTSNTALNHYQDNEIWTFKPDLFITEDPIHNAGGGGKPNAVAHKTYYATITDNFFFADNEISLRARCLALGLPEPEWVIFNSTIAYNFGGFDTETGELFTTQLKDGLVWTALDSQSSCYEYINNKYKDSEAPSVIYINAVKNWCKAANEIWGNLALGTVGSGKTGTTFTNEGSHWNDTGSRIMARTVLPVLDFTTI